MSFRHDVKTSPTLLRYLCDSAHRSQAWHTFVGRYQSLIHDWCRRRGLQHADDVTGVVLLKLVRALETFDYDPSRRFRGWLRKVVEHAVSDFLRGRARRPGEQAEGTEAALAHAEAAAPDVVEGLAEALDRESSPEMVQLGEATLAVRARVGPNTWQAFWLRKVEECDGPEVAQRLGMTVAAVYVAVGRVKGMFRDELARG
jgi:RNA polymerase sigma-70 factor (ECF subfamily)